MRTQDEDVIADKYSKALQTMTFNSKPIINSLTKIAEDEIKYAHIVQEVIEKYLISAASQMKLPILYLIDSIVKNVKGVYVVLFQQHIVFCFCAVFEKVDEATRAAMVKLRRTWGGVFTSRKLEKMDERMEQIQSGWTIETKLVQDTSALPDSSNVSTSAGTSHMHLSGVGAAETDFPVVDCKTPSTFFENATEAQLREQLLIKQKELIDLQQKAIELELMRAKSKLEEQDRTIKKLQERTESTDHEQQNSDVPTRPKSIEGYVVICNHCGVHSSDLHNCERCFKRILADTNLILDPKKNKTPERRHCDKPAEKPINVTSPGQKTENLKPAERASLNHKKSEGGNQKKRTYSKRHEKSKIVTESKSSESHRHKAETESSKLKVISKEKSTSKSKAEKSSCTQEKVIVKPPSSKTSKETEGSVPPKQPRLDEESEKSSSHVDKKSSRGEKKDERPEFREGYVVKCKYCGVNSKNLLTCEGLLCGKKFSSNSELLRNPSIRTPLSSQETKRKHDDDQSRDSTTPTRPEIKKLRVSSTSQGHQVEEIPSTIKRSNSQDSANGSQKCLEQNERDERQKSKKGFVVRCKKCGRCSSNFHKCSKCGKRIPSCAKPFPEPKKKSTDRERTLSGTTTEAVDDDELLEILDTENVEIHTVPVDKESGPGPSKSSTSIGRKDKKVTSTKTSKCEESRKDGQNEEGKRKNKKGFVVSCPSCRNYSRDFDKCGRCGKKLPSHAKLLPDPYKKSEGTKLTSIITQAVVHPPEKKIEITISSSDEEDGQLVPGRRRKRSPRIRRVKTVSSEVERSTGQELGGRKKSEKDGDGIRPRPMFIKDCVVRCKNCRSLSSNLHTCSKCKNKFPIDAVIFPLSRTPSGTTTKPVETHLEAEIIITSEEEDLKTRRKKTKEPLQTGRNPIEKTKPTNVSSKSTIQKSGNQKDETKKPTPKERVNIERHNVTSLPVVVTSKSNEPECARITKHLNQEIVMKSLEEQFKNSEIGDATSFSCSSIRVSTYIAVPKGNVVFAATVAEIGILFDVPDCKNQSLLRCPIPMSNISTIYAHFSDKYPFISIILNPEYGSWLKNKLGMSGESGLGEEVLMFRPETFSLQNVEIIRRIFKNRLVELDTAAVNKKIMEEARASTKTSLAAPTITTPPIPKTTTTVSKNTLNTEPEVVVNTRTTDEGIIPVPVDNPQTQEPETVPEPRLLLSLPACNGVGKLTLYASDLLCLGEEKFINDTMIDFWLGYALSNLSEGDRARTHVFSTFFYKTLTTPAKRITCAPWENDSTLSADEKRHCRVKKWTKNVDIFSKDFIIIPINENNLHWYLAIICFPGVTGMRNMEDGTPLPHIRNRKQNKLSKKPTDEGDVGVKELPDDSGDDGSIVDLSQDVLNSPRVNGVKQPCILTFDSMPSESHTRDYATLRTYIKMEYKVKKKDDERPFSRNDFPACPVRVPDQSNHYDDGIYVLEYFESFFSKPLQSFQFPLRNLDNWFSKSIVRTKRKEMYETISNLIKVNNPENVPYIPHLEFKKLGAPPASDPNIFPGAGPSSKTPAQPSKHHSMLSPVTPVKSRTVTETNPANSAKPGTPSGSMTSRSSVPGSTTVVPPQPAIASTPLSSATHTATTSKASSGQRQSLKVESEKQSVPKNPVKSEASTPTMTTPAITSKTTCGPRPIRPPMILPTAATATTSSAPSATTSSSNSRSSPPPTLSVKAEMVGYWWNNEWKWKEK